MKNTIVVLVVVAIIAIIFVALGPFYVVDEGYQAVVVRFGAIVSSTETAGLKFKMPVVDNVVKYPKKIMSWDGDARKIPTAEKQFIWVDTTARWRIVDPEQFYSSVQTFERAYLNLDDVIDSSVKSIVANNKLVEAVRSSNAINESAQEVIGGLDEDVSLEGLQDFTVEESTFEQILKGRGELSDEIASLVKQVVPQYGIELIDVVIRQIRYSDDLTSSVYQRMIKERNQRAELFRSYGEGQKQVWLGKQQNEQRAILSAARARAEDIKGAADAEAAKIYAAAYEPYPKFYEFWRSIESYRKTLPTFGKTMTTDMEYFKYLYNREGN